MIDNKENATILLEVISGNIKKYKFEDYYYSIKYWASICFKGSEMEKYIQEFVYDVMIKANGLSICHIIDAIRYGCFNLKMFFSIRGIKLLCHCIFD